MYFPKSQIKTSLYTNGGEYTLSTNNTEYKGYYYKISTGEKFTGKFPSNEAISLNPITISSDEKQQSDNQSIIILSPNIKEEQKYRKIPNLHITLPTPQDYEGGKMIRYFTKKTNELIYKEISKETYNKLKSRDESIAWDLYESQKIEWVISNTPINFALRDNKTAVMRIEQKQKWYGFSKFLKEDYTKYWKP